MTDKKKKTVKKKVGRPKIILTEEQWTLAERMAQVQGTGEEIAAVLGINYDTLDARIKDKGYANFSEWFAQKAAGGKISLRRRQFKMSETSPAMAIWLGKQYLGQSDKMDSNVNNSHEAGDKPFEVVFVEPKKDDKTSDGRPDPLPVSSNGR